MTNNADDVNTDLFAQVRKNLDLITDEGHCTCGRVYTCDWCLEQEALDALSSIERHVQDMEIMLRAAYIYYPKGTPMSESMGDLLAALPASREKGEE